MAVDETIEFNEETLATVSVVLRKPALPEA